MPTSARLLLFEFGGAEALHVRWIGCSARRKTTQTILRLLGRRKEEADVMLSLKIAYISWRITAREVHVPDSNTTSQTSKPIRMVTRSSSATVCIPSVSQSVNHYRLQRELQTYERYKYCMLDTKLHGKSESFGPSVGHIADPSTSTEMEP